MKVTLLPSDKGDCLFLEFPNKGKTTILVDGGMPDSYAQHVRPFLGQWYKKNKRPIDLVYVSHIDQDHIGGVLQLMNDLVAWRVYRGKRAKAKKPDFPEPPEVLGIWHNAFHDLVEDNAGEIGSMLAARAVSLSNSADLNVRRLADHYQAIAASIPEAIKLSSRISPQQLGIPLNKEFCGRLAIFRKSQKKFHFPKGGDSPVISVLGPFKEDVEKFRDKWNKWLLDKKNQTSLNRTREWRGRESDRLTMSDFQALDSNELGDRSKVTEENLASLMLYVEHGGKTMLLTGDGHYTDILHGLTDSNIIKKGNQPLHVDVLKIQHHGSEHNLTAEFADQITADHYIICGNGRHENPDIKVLDRIFDGGLKAVKSRDNGKQKRHFHVWFNCSTTFLERDIERRKRQRVPFKEYEKALEHFKKIDKCVTENAKSGRVKVHYLTGAPLVLDLAAGGKPARR